MTSEDDDLALREHQKTFYKLVAKSWLDPTLKERLTRDRADALKELGVTDLTEAQAAALAQFIDGDIDPPEPWLQPHPDPRTTHRQADRLEAAPEAERPFSMARPRLVEHVYVRAEPPDASGTEALHFISSRRQLKLEGRRLHAFRDLVLPLLDGRHTMDAIDAATQASFQPAELRKSLALLESHDLLQDAANDTLPESLRTRFAPQLNFFHELGVDAQETQAKLSKATVTVVGMGGAGASACLALAAAHVGNLRCVDGLPVSSPDPIIAPVFAAQSVGRPRAQVVAEAIEAAAPEVAVTACTGVLDTDDDVSRAIDGSDFVICCVDPGLASLVYKVNRACLRAKISWIACSASGFEAVIGPTVEPAHTACYLCYHMREAACAERPEDALAHLEFLDARKRDDSSVRESNAFSTGAAGNLVALEAFKKLSGVVDPISLGHIVVVDFLRLATTRHLVLRKPDCPACAQSRSAGGEPGQP